MQKIAGKNNTAPPSPLERVTHANDAATSVGDAQMIDSMTIGLVVVIPVIVVALVFSLVYTMQWMTAFLFSAMGVSIDDMYMGEE